MLRKRLLLIPVLFMLVAALLLGACQPAAPAAEEPAPAQEEDATPAGESQSEESVPETEDVSSQEDTSPTEEIAPLETSEETNMNEPQVGGTLFLSIAVDRDTFDIDKTVNGTVESRLVGSSLLAFHPETNEIVPHLAESWTVSEDGLIYDFKLREDVKFHNGDPLTAHDFVYTLQRAQDPEIASPYAGTMWAPVIAYEALDDYTLRLELGKPNFPFLINLISIATQPISQRAIEELGESYGRNPVGVGPFILKEWQTGEKMVFSRNPDYVWGPDFLENTGPAYIETIVVRIIPEYSTQLAGLEADELDLVQLEKQDVNRITDDERFKLIQSMGKGMPTYVEFNVSKPPFDNILVRKAFNLAINRDALVTLLLQGQGLPLYGPISHDTTGYDPIVEEIGYHYDLEQAKALMQEAGYTYDDNGMLLTPEGDPFVLDFPVYNYTTSEAEVLSEQFKALGVEMNIQLEEFSINWSRQLAGDYEICISALGWADGDVMFYGMHSSMLGIVNAGQINDPILDEILERTRIVTNQTERQKALTEAQLYAIENALTCPLYSQYSYIAVNERVENLTYSKMDYAWFENAYISE